MDEKHGWPLTYLLHPYRALGVSEVHALFGRPYINRFPQPPFSRAIAHLARYHSAPLPYRGDATP